MGYGHSMDLRQRIIGAVQAGASARQAARRFQVSPASAIKLVARWRRTGSYAPGQVGGQKKRRLADHQDWLREVIARTPDITLAELQTQLAAQRVAISQTTIHTTLRALGCRYKKTTRAAEQQRPEVAAQRQRWRREQPQMTPQHLVFLDETAAKTNLSRLRGRSLVGQRLYAAVPFGGWTTSTFVAGLRLEGWTAPLVVDGAINGATFKACVEQSLAPSLRAGDVVVMDNVSNHKVAGVRQATPQAGAQVRYLPPYSLDLNPIEQAFAKLKSLLRKAAARSVSELCRAIGECLDVFEPDECANFFRNSGYEPKQP